MSKSNRKNDMNAEQIVGRWMDTWYYSRLKATSDRKSDLDSQFKGIDVQVSTKKGHVMNIDEKAAITYINKPIRTFSFEVDFINRAGNIHQGWLFDDSLETDYYLLMYLTGTEEDIKKLTEESITSIETILVSRTKILNYLSDKKDMIENTSTFLRDRGENGRYYVPGESNFSFYHSTWLAEKPVNVLISKNELSRLSARHHKVSRDGLVSLK